MKMNQRFFIRVAIFGTASIALVAGANHSWGGYHWARTSNPFIITLGDNLTTSWDPYLATASSDWSTSTVLDTVVVAGATNAKICKTSKGKVEVCNSKYGNNGWLGIAGIYASGGHITQGYVKMNDTYFNTTKYNTPAWKNLVLCQEVGHIFGLDHQDEDFANASLGTCMDYSNDPVPNQHPNQHDYEMLETIYAHLDAISTVNATYNSSNPAEFGSEDPKDWGKEIRKSKDGRSSVFEKDLGNGNKKFTHVFWAE